MIAKSRMLAMTLLALAGLAAPAAAQNCRPEDVSAVIDATGARLREINGEWQIRLRAKLRDLAARNGWSESEVETKGRSTIEDDETRNLDQRAAELLAELDRLGDESGSAVAPCDRLEQARTKGSQLVEVTIARSSHVIARIEAALRPAAAAPPATSDTAVVRQAPTSARDPASRQAMTPPLPSRPKAPTNPSWDTQTVRDAEPSPAAMAELPPLPDPGDLGYSPDEIAAAGRGFFGSISAGLASVIDFAVQRYGKPTGYVLGDEGGGAFFAGLRYGSGRLVTKSGGERRVYWQGPSAGFDFGLAGSQVMFLVYNASDHQELFQRFTGIDGSAYLVGGVGITFLKRGKVILAPIRTGLGLRVGASVGYLKFTPTPSLNPF